MIGKVLGHSSIQSTALHAHLDDNDLVEEAERVGRIIAEMTGVGGAGRGGGLSPVPPSGLGPTAPGRLRFLRPFGPMIAFLASSGEDRA
jgi:hypothetical protein